MKMKRPLAIGCVASLVIVTGFSSCGKAPGVCDPGVYLDTPQLCSDQASLGFGLEFRTGVTIGTAPQRTIDIRNGGTANLVVESASRTGDGAFRSDLGYELPDGGQGSTLPATIRGGDHLFIRVIFTPTQPIPYSGQIAVRSNAGPEAIGAMLDVAAASGFTAVLTANRNQPDGGFVFLLSGCGVPPDGGTSPCYFDGGVP
jgi:hypothetical protein